MKLEPYLYFDGNCEEALTLYARVLDGTIGEITRYDSPHMTTPEAYRNRILHTTFTFEGGSLMASDRMPEDKAVAGSNVSLAIGSEDIERTRRIFDELSTGATALMPLEKQFWGAWFGQFTDRFGIQWMFNCRA